MKTREGNLITLAQNGEFDVIVHGCNCFCTMGAGIAKAIKSAYPEAYRADKATPRGDRSKLGTISFVTIKSLTIVNAYTQYDWRGKKPLANYKAIKSVFKKIKQKFPGKRIGYPLIGAGLAGGDWNTISNIIDEELNGEDHTAVILK